jgi:hypothetical protein
MIHPSDRVALFSCLLALFTWTACSAPARGGEEADSVNETEPSIAPLQGEQVPSVQEPLEPDTSRDLLSTGLPKEDLPRSGPGTYSWAQGGSPVSGRGAIKKYSVGVEEGLDIDVEEFAAFVDETYADPRGWLSDTRRNWGFQRVESGGIRVVIATPKTVDKQCRPLRTEGEVSCAKQGYISINLDRWELAVPHWDGTLEEYRRYVVNHEMGHYLNKPHEGCPKVGEPAPVMMQQTYFLKGCTGNPWVHPTPSAREPEAAIIPSTP